MSNNAMSNETDLDWLARNVHKWPEITPQSIPTGDRTFEYGCTFYENHICIYHKEFANSMVIYKNQWLSRRAELQSVTEQFKPSIEEANMLAQEFKPFASIEDGQEHEMKQDNGWYERGELPPVGTECEALWNEGRMEYLRTKVFGVNEHGQPIHRFGEGPKKFEYQADPLVTILGTRVFRPIRTERDVLISVIIDEMNRYDTDAKLADAIIAAGFKLEAK